MAYLLADDRREAGSSDGSGGCVGASAYSMMAADPSFQTHWRHLYRGDLTRSDRSRKRVLLARAAAARQPVVDRLAEARRAGPA